MLRPETYLADPGYSWWFKDALRSALERDPVESANDAQILANILRDYADQILREQPKRKRR